MRSSVKRSQARSRKLLRSALTWTNHKSRQSPCTGMAAVCSTKKATVVTPTNCSTSCGMLSSRSIVGASITCSATTGRNVSKNCGRPPTGLAQVHREPGRARPRCRRAAPPSPATAAPTWKPAASRPWACLRPTRAQNTRQVPPPCWCQSSVPAGRRSRCPPWGTSGGTP